MNYDHILAFQGTSIEKHEYLRFDSRPKDETVIGRIQECCAVLARRAELTRRGWSEDSLKLDMVITADGKRYSSETMSELYAGIEALDTANAFSIERPIFPLFSGWNWQPMTEPRPTAAVMSAPYSAVASRLSPQSVP